MLDVVIVAAALATAVPGPVVGVIAVAAMAPPIVGGGVLVAALAVAAAQRAPEGASDRESVFLRAIASELRAGASVRAAASAAADRVPQLGLETWAYRASAGVPLADLGAELRARLPQAGTAAAAAFEFASTSGASAVDVFTGLAQQVDDALALDRERRMATAQARLSAFVVAAAPIPVLVWLLARGTLTSLLGTGPGRAVLGLGLALEIAGIGATVYLLRRVSR